MTEVRKMWFGKYKGINVKDVILYHIGYIMWCFNNLPWFSLTEDEQDLYDAVAISAKIDDTCGFPFPKENLYQHVKDKYKLEKGITPFIESSLLGIRGVPIKDFKELPMFHGIHCNHDEAFKGCKNEYKPNRSFIDGTSEQLNGTGCLSGFSQTASKIIDRFNDDDDMCCTETDHNEDFAYWGPNH